MHSYRRLSTLAIVALVILRIAVGWHFFNEGESKVRKGGFSSVGFLGAAVGPMSPMFHSMIPDFDGRIRTDKEKLYPRIDAYAQHSKATYGFSEAQGKLVDAAVVKAKDRLDLNYARNQKELIEYRDGFARIENMKNDKSRKIASLEGQEATIETEWKGKAKPFLKGVDTTLKLLGEDVRAIAKPDQLQGKPELAVTFGNEPMVDTAVIDKIIPIFDMVVGILLVIGLLTPVAGIAAGLFLVSVVLTQFPGSAGAQPTYYQAIEAVACFLLAFADAGRYAGLDFLPWAFWNRRRVKTTKTTVATTRAA